MAFAGRTFGSITHAGYQAAVGAFPTVPPTAEQAAVVYAYENVAPPSPTAWHVGSIRYRQDDEYGVAYIYENVT